jgi:hypothetical protein
MRIPALMGNETRRSPGTTATRRFRPTTYMNPAASRYAVASISGVKRFSDYGLLRCCGADVLR